MFFRLLWESFRRQRRRKLLAGVAILLGTTAVTAMLALATTIGDRIHRELAVYGANIVITPAAAGLEVNVGGVEVRPATGSAYLKESDLEKLQGIFWANNITGVSPELRFTVGLAGHAEEQKIPAVGLWFGHVFGTGTGTTGAPAMHPLWRLVGAWPSAPDQGVAGRVLAEGLGLKAGDTLALRDGSSTRVIRVSGVVDADEETNGELLLPLATAQVLAGLPGAVSMVEVSAKTRPEDAFARKDPAALSPKDRDVWYCRPYANSIAFQIREAIPGADAEQVRRVEQSEGNVLKRISGLMWLVSLAALVAAGFAVSAAMATAILERRGEIGLLRSLGASRGAVAALFYVEAAVLAVVAGSLGFLAGSGLAAWLGARIFPGESAGAVLNPVLLPVVVGLALLVAVAGSTPAIRQALRMEPSAVLRAGA